MTATAFSDADWIEIEKDEWMSYKMEKEEINVCAANLTADAKVLATSTIEVVKCAAAFAVSVVNVSSAIVQTAASASYLTFHLCKLAYTYAAAKSDSDKA